MKKPDIILVDDHEIFRQGIKSIITLENIGNVIGEASNGLDFIELLSHFKPDLVLLDIDMPFMNGLEATEKALEIMPDIKIIAFTLFGDEEYFLKMIELGAKGYILKSSDVSEIEKAIKLIMKGEKYFCSNQFQTGSKSVDNNKLKSNKFKGMEDLFPQWY